jgi:hypothetical protein
VKDAAGPTGADATVTVLVAFMDPEPLVTVRVTVCEPDVAKAWLGFWAALVVPSPKLHFQEVGVPADVSVNCTACPITGEAGL